MLRMKNPKLTREKPMATQRNIIIITCRPVFSFFTICGKTVKKKKNNYSMCIFFMTTVNITLYLCTKVKLYVNKTIFIKQSIQVVTLMMFYFSLRKTN